MTIAKWTKWSKRAANISLTSAKRLKRQTATFCWFKNLFSVMLWTILLSTSSSNLISSWSKTLRGTKLSSRQKALGANLWRRARSLAPKLCELLEWKTQGGQWVFWRWGVTRLSWKNASRVCTMHFVLFDALFKSGASSRSLHWDESWCLQFECRALIGVQVPQKFTFLVSSRNTRNPLKGWKPIASCSWSDSDNIGRKCCY